MQQVVGHPGLHNELTIKAKVCVENTYLLLNSPRTQLFLQQINGGIAEEPRLERQGDKRRKNSNGKPFHFLHGRIYVTRRDAVHTTSRGHSSSACFKNTNPLKPALPGQGNYGSFALRHFLLPEVGGWRDLQITVCVTLMPHPLPNRCWCVSMSRPKAQTQTWLISKERYL